MSIRMWVRSSAAATVAAAAALAFAVPASAATTTVSGSAFGVQITGSPVTLAPTPSVTLPASGCTVPPCPIVAQVASVIVPNLVSTGLITVSTNGAVPPGTATSSATVLTLAVPLAFLTADSVSSTCTSTYSGSTGSTTLLNARYLGGALSVTPAANTVVVNIAGVLRIVLNEQTSSGGTGTSSITVTAIHVTLGGLVVPAQNIYIAQSHCDVTSGTTAVRLQSFAASRAPGSVVLRWRTASELQTVGFNVYRQVGTRLVKVNAKPIAAHGSTGGAAYTLVDRTAPRSGVARYRLQGVQLSGARVWLSRTSLTS